MYITMFVIKHLYRGGSREHRFLKLKGGSKEHRFLKLKGGSREYRFLKLKGGSREFRFPNIGYLDPSLTFKNVP